ncbi:MAG: hypothetical protein ACK5UE_05390 [Chitinophagales bacterium]
MKYILIVIFFSIASISNSQAVSNIDNSQGIKVDAGMAYFLKGDEGTTRCLDAWWICKISYSIEKDNDPNQSIAINNNGRLSIKFNMNAYSKEEKEKYFSNDFFIMENDRQVEEFILPENLVEKLNLTHNTIPKGKYPILRDENSNFVTVNF